MADSCPQMTPETVFVLNDVSLFSWNVPLGFVSSAVSMLQWVILLQRSFFRLH